jgi:fumarate reductase subunit C
VEDIDGFDVLNGPDSLIHQGFVDGCSACISGLANVAGFVGFLQNPIVVILNIIVLAAALLHTKTWFELAPKAANIIVKGEKMGPEPVIKGLWVVTAVVTVVILGIALFW